jgi:hypothetical protein
MVYSTYTSLAMHASVIQYKPVAYNHHYLLEGGGGYSLQAIALSYSEYSYASVYLYTSL